MSIFKYIENSLTVGVSKDLKWAFSKNPIYNKAIYPI
ncbi:hypothetical protein AEQU3_03500 [Aequorivita antarctica]|nr:hypothetical protein AEQU3_03500 [Aequorivita antarctica]